MKLSEITKNSSHAEIIKHIQQQRLKQISLRKVNDKPFDPTTTDTPFYDNMLNGGPVYAKQKGYEVTTKWMSPNAYIWECADGFRTSYNKLKQSRGESDKVDDYVNKLQNGETFPMLVLEYLHTGRFKQEGLHRAFAAMKWGLEKVPVLILKELQPPEYS